MLENQVFRPSGKLARKLALWIWTIFVLGILPFVLLGLIPGAGWLYVGLFLAANALWMVPLLLLVRPYVRSIEYQLGDQEIIVRRGIITKTVDAVPYRAVTNLSIKRGPYDRMLGLGSLVVHTAGFSQQTGAEAQLSGLEDHQAVYARVLEQVRRFRATSAIGVPGQSEVKLSDQDSLGLLKQILDELRALHGSVKQG